MAPVMHPVNVRIHHWFVPHRILWDDFEDFITGGPDGHDVSVFPTVTMPSDSGAAVGSLADYLGVPPGVANLEVSALPFRAYNMIYNEWYRDQDLQSEVPLSTASGSDTTTSLSLLNASWEKDYFTSARPWEQKGPAVTIPLGTTAPVEVTGVGFYGTGTGMTSQSGVRDSGGSTATYSQAWKDHTSPQEPRLIVKSTNNTSGQQFPDIKGIADLSNASAVTVGVLREALALQRYEEARARYGSRYVEYLRYLGVRSSDARLQRPEYLGGGRQTIQFSEVLQTAEGTDPVGEMRGHGISAVRTNRYRRFFEEHGYIITIMSVRPRTIYAQGLFRHWNKRTKEDFWQRELEHIGQQEVLNKELYAASPQPEGVFGFQDRYDEYRRTESTIAGEFRSTLLDHWHMARIFSNAPALNADFVKAVPTKRTFAVPSQDVLYVMANHSIQARRLVSQIGKSFIY